MFFIVLLVIKMETVEKIKCPGCKGTGKKTWKVMEFTPENKEGTRKPDFAFRCFSCEGKGYMTKIDRIVSEWESNIWCKCERDCGITFYNDGEHPEISKHHVRCNKCGKVAQIG
jgi:hypothetical protein